MAMAMCPQCDGEMSNYAPSCPHCGKMNPAAPQAILLQQKRENVSTFSQTIPEPSISVDPVGSVSTEKRFVNNGSSFEQWITELQQEWRGLTPSKKSAMKTLFGFAILVATGLLLYAVAS